MATRYSRRRSDGTIAYYDSEAEMYAAVTTPGLFDFSWFWASIGFAACLLVGLIVAYQVESIAAWPKWLRFVGVLAVAGIGGYAIGRLGQSLLYVFWVLLALAMLAGIGALIWQYA